jgi:hypothetical protein
MKRASSRILAWLALLALALALPACGSGGGGGSATSTSTAARMPATDSTDSTSTPTSTTTTAKPATHSPGADSTPSPSAHKSTPAPRLVRKAGRAAAFLVPTGDNSIPTYGAEANTGQIAAATAALRAYLEARAAGDWGTACAHTAATLQKQLALLVGAQGAASACASTYEKLASRAPASARADLLSGALAALRVDGETAFALFYGPQHHQYMMPLASEGGAWKVSQIAPIPWPVGAPTASP